MKLLITLMFVAMGTATAWAHSSTKATTPADGDILSVAPEAIELTFNNDIRLTRIELVASNGARQDLELDPDKGFEGYFSLTPPAISTGRYTIEWRGLGMDGHAMSGQFSFTVQ